MRGARRLAAIAALSLLQGGPAPAKSTNYAVGEFAYGKLSAAQELMGAENFTEARKILEKMLGKRLNDHERALTLQSLGFVQASQEQWDAATESFEKCLAQEALPPGAQSSTRYNVAQIYLLRERYADSAKTLETWFTEVENPGSAAYYLLATAYALDGQYDRALPPAEKAVALADDPKEQWLQILLNLYFEKQDFKKLARTLERLASRYPKKVYWMQLSAVYAELGKDEKSLAVLQVAYENDLLTEDVELRRLAQLYLFHEIPYRAARVLERALEEEKIESDAESLELLANSWIQAREYERAIPPLERAAALAGDGDLYVRLGQIHLERRAWGKAEEALTQALSHKELDDRGRVWLLLGVSRYSAKRVTSAEEAFANAGKFDSTRDSATTWLGHIERDRAARAN